MNHCKHQKPRSYTPINLKALDKRNLKGAAASKKSRAKKIKPRNKQIVCAYLYLSGKTGTLDHPLADGFAIAIEMKKNGFIQDPPKALNDYELAPLLAKMFALSKRQINRITENFRNRG